MWLDEADGFAEIFRGYLPYYLLVALPIFIIMSPVNPVAASHEFSVYRMQQYDLHTVPHGCRSSTFNLEGRSLTSWSTSRHCVVARVQDITVDHFMEMRSKAGALLLILPKNDTILTVEEKEHIQLLEMAMTQQELNAPVYFAKWTPEFEDILRDLQHSFVTDDRAGTALEAMMNTVSSNGYQIVVSATTPQKMDSKPATLYGKLVGRSGSAQSIVIAAHYDSSGIVPELAQGADSNASGVVAVLELARIFSRLYSSTAARGAPSLIFLLTSVGHTLNYFATKKWLEEHLDTGDASLLQDVSFVMCLDSISSAPSVTMHVSKPPKAGGAAHSFRSRLGAPVTHKKINLADELLAWHHERFSIRRMTAFTLSSLQCMHRQKYHFQMSLDLLDMVPELIARQNQSQGPGKEYHSGWSDTNNVEYLVDNIAATARALASHIYNLTSEDNDEDRTLYDDALGVDEASIKHWYQYLSSQSRAPQIVTTATSNAGVTGALERALSRYMEATLSTHVVDKREPEYALYSPTSAILYVYSVKPAVFDLILTIVIVAYLTLVYFAIQLFPRFYEEYAKIVTGKAKVQ